MQYVLLSPEAEIERSGLLGSPTWICCCWAAALSSRSAMRCSVASWPAALRSR